MKTLYQYCLEQPHVFQDIVNNTVFGEAASYILK